MLHFVFDHPYTRSIAVLVLAVLLTFIDRIAIFHTREMFYILLVITLMMLFSTGIETHMTTPYVDYGFILLLMAMLVMTFNNIRIHDQSSKP